MPADLYGGALNEHFAAADESMDETDSSGIFINGASTPVSSRARSTSHRATRGRGATAAVAAAAAMPSSQRPGGDGDDAAAAVGGPFRGAWA